LLLDRETERLDIEDRDEWESLFELLRELCLLPELFEDDLDDDDLLFLLDAKTGSIKITAPSIIISTNFCLNLDSFMIKSRTNSIFDIMSQIASEMAIIILAKQLQFVK
jgi:hypothetical protein